MQTELNSIDQPAAPADIDAVFTEATCGIARWNAREKTCRCSCGGCNHGVYHRGGNAVRTSKINGFRYELIGVGSFYAMRKELQNLIVADEIAAGRAIKKEDGRVVTVGPALGARFDATIERSYYPPNVVGRKAGGKYRLMPARVTQCTEWPELAHFNIETKRDHAIAKVTLLWKLIEPPAAGAKE